MKYIKNENYDKEHEKLSKHFLYGVMLPAILAGSFGWGCYFAKQYEDTGKKNVSSACEADKPYLRTLPVSRYQR